MGGMHTCNTITYNHVCINPHPQALATAQTCCTEALAPTVGQVIYTTQSPISRCMFVLAGRYRFAMMAASTTRPMLRIYRGFDWVGVGVGQSAVSAYTYIHTDRQAYKHTYIHADTHAYIHAYKHTNKHTYIHTDGITSYIHTYTFTSIQTHTYIHTYIQADIHTGIHTYIWRERQADTQTYRHIQIHTYTYRDKQRQGHTYIHIIHTYIHTHIQTDRQNQTYRAYIHTD